jgi:hypothetical protein
MRAAAEEVCLAPPGANLELHTCVAKNDWFYSDKA